ncbi:hypothetical protein Scep_018111 [Stephania cephalantha]|uniref:4-coumarate--CoA ligase n=1 Tax=Stephania cephalantha TaxID=152367 RepID=A0AAP0IS62_9MAGN
MAETIPRKSTSSIDPNSGFCSETNVYHNLRPRDALPPPHLPISAADHAFSLLHQSLSNSLHTTASFIDSTTARRLSYSDFLRHVGSLSSALQSRLGFSKGDTAFVLSPTCLEIPILYFSLLSLGVAFSPANPLSTPAEISRQIQISKPSVAFAAKSTAHKLPHTTTTISTILIDSDYFNSMMTMMTLSESDLSSATSNPIQSRISQSDTAAILYSSGTTGRVKGVELTHGNMIAGISTWPRRRGREVVLITTPLFHTYGVAMCVKAVAMGETAVLMTSTKRFDLEVMLKAVEDYRVTWMPVSPPIVVAMAKAEAVERYDLSSLREMLCGGAPLGKDASERFKARFPHGYGLTESAVSPARMLDAEEAKRHGSVGRLNPHVDVKVIDTVTGMAQSPGRRGELWIRGAGTMKGYVGDEEATASALDDEGWLKTGDLGYIDRDGFVYIIDRLKELIKYKSYQVPPAELEHLLQSHPEIVDSAVIPYPDEDAGEIPMAFVVRKPGSTLNEAQVAPHKKLRRVSFCSAIPKSAAGKILRRELIEHALSSPSPKL